MQRVQVRNVRNPRTVRTVGLRAAAVLVRIGKYEYVAESPEPTPVEFPEPQPVEVPQGDPIDVPPPAGPTDPEVPEVEFQPSARLTKAGKPDRRYRRTDMQAED